MNYRILLSMGLILAAACGAWAQTGKRPARTITNADLEKFKQKRLAAEREYEEKYKEFGFPSPEELRERNRLEQLQKLELADRWREERLQNQGDWQSRASFLRSQIASVEAQIGYLRGRLPTFPGINPKLVGTAVYGGDGSRPSRRGGTVIIGSGGGTNRAVVRNAPPSPSPAYFPIQSFPPYSANRPYPDYGYDRRGRRGYYGYPYYGGYFPPAIIDSTDYSEQQLLQGIQYLEQQRAGLYAEWNNLVEEARRAGVRID